MDGRTVGSVRPAAAPLPWIALGSGRFSIGYITFWLLAPLIACAIATGITLKGDPIGSSLSIVGVFVILTPRILDHYLELIRTRVDHRGGPATFSLHVLYWCRVLRSVAFTAWLLCVVLAMIPAWRPQVLRFSLLILYMYIPMFTLRFIGAIGLVDRWMDQVGTKLGFPPKSQHYQ